MAGKHRGGYRNGGHGGGRGPVEPAPKYRGMAHTGDGSRSGGQGVKSDRHSLDKKASGDSFTRHSGTHVANTIGPMRGGIRF